MKQHIKIGFRRLFFLSLAVVGCLTASAQSSNHVGRHRIGLDYEFTTTPYRHSGATFPAYTQNSGVVSYSYRFSSLWEMGLHAGLKSGYSGFYVGEETLVPHMGIHARFHFLNMLCSPSWVSTFLSCRGGLSGNSDDLQFERSLGLGAEVYPWPWLGVHVEALGGTFHMPNSADFVHGHLRLVAGVSVFL